GIGKNRLELHKTITMKQLLIFFAFIISAFSFGQNTYLHCGKLIDTKSGKILTERTVIVSGKKIVSVENGYVMPTSQEDTVIDLKTKTVMPGLIDMHVHLESETNPKSYLEDFTLNDADIAFNSLQIGRAS